MLKGKKPWFSTLATLFAISSVIGLAIVGGIIATHQKPNVKQSAATTTQVASASTVAGSKPTTQQPNTWNTYNDTGYAAASGIALKYAPDWKINIPGVKSVGATQTTTAAINERVIFLPSAETPKDEWNTCATNISADACGADPADKTLNDSESTINGLAAYTATMQKGDGSTYHVTVIRGNKATSDGIPFVEFTTTANDPAALNTYSAIMASATFPN